MLKLGSQGEQVLAWQEMMRRRFKSYAVERDGGPLRADSYFGYSDQDVASEWQRRLRRPVTGQVSDDELRILGLLPGMPAAATSTTWVYTAAGTGAPWWVGPQFEIGKHAEFRGLNHQPLAYPAGGFLGQPDPKLSYNESIAILKNEWARLLRLNTVGDIVTIGYSQSADGLQRAAAELFGEDGEFESQRHRLRMAVMLGNPTRVPGPTKLGNNPKGAGIARWYPPDWLQDATVDITTHDDLYACATNNTLVPLFYPWFVKAETELPFVAYSAQIIIPAIASYFGIAAPLLTGALGAGGVTALAFFTRIAVPALTQMLGAASDAPPPDPKLVAALSAQGVLGDIPRLIRTLRALAGIHAHNSYHVPRPEFGGRTGITVGFQLIDQL